MLIAEELLLLLLDDESGKLTHATYLDAGIGGALLVELALAEHVDVVKQGRWSRAKVHPTASTATSAAPEDPVLLEALAVVAEKERTAQDLVTRLGKRRRDQLLGRLAEHGVVRREDDKVLGMFPRHRWPAVDSRHEADVRRRLGDTLLRGVGPEPRTGGLVAVLSAMDLAHQVIEREGLPARQVKKRAKEVAEGDWAAKAVRDAIAAAQAAVAGAVVAATAGGAAASG
jgi:hypothetical protein